MSSLTFPRKTCKAIIHSILSFIVFLFLDFLETILCPVYKHLDDYFEGKHASPCYCAYKEDREKNGDAYEQVSEEMSETLYKRRNIFRETTFLRVGRKSRVSEKIGINGGLVSNRWSDCGCETCVDWMKKNGDDYKLHVVMKESSIPVSSVDSEEKPMENVIFLHGFLSSSSYWTETVFEDLCEHFKGKNYRFLAVDLLGFGKSPKPKESLYTLRDHVEMIEKSVICEFELNSFHVVGHSMGCIVAVALAASQSKMVKSVTIVAPPYFPSSSDGGSRVVLERLVGKRLWPPLAFGSSVMSWYEHVGRCVCFFVCRYHRTWERILKLLTRKRDLHFLIMDMTRHTHHSAWHTMHNVICGGAKLTDTHLETLLNSKVKLCIIQGDQDAVVPLECSENLKKKFPDAEVNIIANADHASVIMSRVDDFIRILHHVWSSSSSSNFV